MTTPRGRNGTEYQRRDPERHRAQKRAMNRARYRAIKLLIARYPWEYDALYRAEAAEEGVAPTGRHGSKAERTQLEREIEALQLQLRRLGGEDG